MADASRTATYSALSSYGFRRDRDGSREPVLPEVPGIVHAVARPVGLVKSFPDFVSGGGASALCGARVRVRLPAHFDGAASDSCKACAAHVESGTHAPPRYRSRETKHAVTVRSDDEDQPTTFWIACTCGHVGRDRTTYSDALLDQGVHLAEPDDE